MLGEFSFHTPIATGHIFWRAPNELVQQFVRRMARKRSLPCINSDNDVDTDANNILPRDALGERFHQRLLSYERAAKRYRKAPVFIINLHQNQSYMKSMSQIVPTLLTRTSMLWSMTHQRVHQR